MGLSEDAWFTYAKMVRSTEMSSAQDHRGHPRNKRTRTERTKRDDILAAAIARFSRDGYENTKWADVAADVGVGPTALYHYFDSKQHCLFVILDDAIRDALARFERITVAEPDFERALQLVIADAFDVTVLDIQRLRVLEAEHGLLARRHGSAPEGQHARQAARAHTRDLERAWTTFLERAMDAGAVRKSDPRLLARAVLGLYNSIWHWYRPEGIIPLDVVATFYRAKLLGVIGAEPPLTRACARRERFAGRPGRAVALAQLALEDLAGRCARQVVDDFDRARQLVARQARARKCEQIRR